jgi:hypothetical protein
MTAHTKSLSPSTSFAVRCTVPSLLGGFSRAASLVLDLDIRASFSSACEPPLILPCLKPPEPPFCVTLDVLRGAELGTRPLEDFWCPGVGCGSGGEGRIVMAVLCLVTRPRRAGHGRRAVYFFQPRVHSTEVLVRPICALGRGRRRGAIMSTRVGPMMLNACKRCSLAMKGWQWR